MYDKWPGKEGDMRFLVGAKPAKGTVTWQPELEAIRAIFEYVRATARFEIETGQTEPQ